MLTHNKIHIMQMIKDREKRGPYGRLHATLFLKHRPNRADALSAKHVMPLATNCKPIQNINTNINTPLITSKDETIYLTLTIVNPVTAV